MFKYAVTVWIVLLISLAFINCERVDNKKEKKGTNTTLGIDGIKPMASFRQSMVMNMDSSAPPTAGSWEIEGSIELKKKKTLQKEQELKESTTKDTGTKKETEHKGLSLKDDIVYSALSSGVKSSLKYANYIKEKQYKEYAKKVGLDVVVNLGTRLLFRQIKGQIGNIVQFGLFIGTTLLNCKDKTISEALIYCLKQIVKLIFLIICGIISGKITKNIALKGILYGVFGFIVESGISSAFNLLKKN